LTSLSGTDTITIDKDIRWHVVVVVFGEQIESILDAFFDLRLNHFLTLLLDDEVRVVLRHLLVD